MPFQLESDYKPRGDQGQAIAKLIKSVEAGNRHQTLLGVTGSGKTFTIANVIQRDRKSTRLNSSHSQISYAVFCLKKKTPACEARAAPTARSSRSCGRRGWRGS